MTDGKDERCGEVAMQAAQRAVKITDEKQADMLSTVAFLYSERGEYEQAVAWQRKAVEHKESSANPQGVERMMQRYEAALASSK